MLECQRILTKGYTRIVSQWLNKSILCLVVMLLMLSFVHPQLNHVPLKPDGNTIENEMSEGGSHYYKVKMGDNFERGKDLVIALKGTEAKSDPDLYISATNQEPSGRNDSDYSCAMVGEDICTIPSSAISPGSIFYIAAKCYRKCSYSISASLLSEVRIRNKKDYSMTVKAGEKRIFTFKNTHASVRSIYFTARADRATSSMRMYLKEGTEGVPTSSDMRSSDSWENGIIIKATNKTLVKVKKDQTYKLLFEADDDVTITLRIDLIFRDKIISEGTTYDDFVYFNDKSCYKYDVKTSDKKLRIGAYSFSGNPDIYVTPGIESSENLDTFKFKATEPSDDVIVLSPEDRSKAGQKKGWYLICVIGKSATSYRLRVVESNENYFLEDGIAETNEIKSGENLTFFYTDEALTRDLNITFTLSPKSGPSLKLYAKFCGRIPEEQCSIGNSDSAGVIESFNEFGQLHSFISHLGSQCKKNAGSQTEPCLYVIEVRSPQSLKDSISQFSLVAHHNETSYIMLREGISIENIVENKQYRYFRFINHDPHATNITFTLVSHHGDADMYISKSEKYPNSLKYDK